MKLQLRALIKSVISFLLFVFCRQQGLFAQQVRFVKPGGAGTGNTWANASGDLQATIDASYRLVKPY